MVINPDRTNTCLIWDDQGMPPKGPWKRVVWNSFAQNEESDIVSLPRFLEDHSAKLKADYLSWIYELGRLSINGKRLVDYFELRPGLSYWWLMSISHKPNLYQSQHIVTAMKCLAFDHFCRQNAHQFKKIRLHTHDKVLSEIFRQFCFKGKMEFSFEPVEVRSSHRSFRKLMSSSLPPLLKACLYLLKTLMDMSKRKALPPFPNSPKKQGVVFFDILVHLDPKALSEGAFYSNYWNKLPELVNQMGFSATYVHIFYRHKDIKSLSAADKLISRFNQQGDPDQRHILLDSLLTARVAYHGVEDFVRLICVSFKIPTIRTVFRHKPSEFDFWPLFEREWYASLRGPSALRDCITLNNYEALLNSIPAQVLGIYIQENQPWEMALISSWRRAGHGKLLGMPHTTVRYWDLRYFYDSRTYHGNGSNSLPMPDYVALNGQPTVDIYKEAGYSQSETIQVEALRFFHLKANRKRPHRKEGMDSSAPCIAICGDNIPGSNEKLFRSLQSAVPNLPKSVRFVFKAHKARPFNVSKYGLPNLTVFDGHLTEFFEQADLLVTGNISSAAVDGLLSGLPVFTLLDPDSLNCSPLRGMPGVTFFSTESDLVNLMVHSATYEHNESVSFFFLDEELPRWKSAILSQAAGEPPF